MGEGFLNMRILDTGFLIDLQREWARDEPGVASAYLQAHSEEEFAISVVTAIEFLEGYEEPADGERFLAPFRQIEVSSRAARIGGHIRRSLRQTGQMIGDFDILIATAAVEYGTALVTDNFRHFQRIDGLRVEGYR